MAAPNTLQGPAWSTRGLERVHLIVSQRARARTLFGETNGGLSHVGRWH
jgi:hypothetical protein